MMRRGWILSKQGNLEGSLRRSRKVCLNEIPVCFVGTKPYLQRLVQNEVVMCKVMAHPAQLPALGCCGCPEAAAAAVITTGIGLVNSWEFPLSKF